MINQLHSLLLYQVNCTNNFSVNSQSSLGQSTIESRLKDNNYIKNTSKQINQFIRMCKKAEK
jgi:hypothetical protein